MARGTLTLTLFGGPGDGRTMDAPADADFLDYAVKHGKPLFDPHGKISFTTHRYWIERSTSGTHGIALHAGAVAYRRESVTDGLDPRDAEQV